MKTKTPVHRLKTLFVGKARDIAEEGLFHKMSLIAVLAWVGLGADGLSSSCYGPEETMKALVAHPSLALFVALATVVTIGVICASYSQIISVFPGGGGGYVVASKLLSPAAGVTSGCAQCGSSCSQPWCSILVTLAASSGNTASMGITEMS